MPEAKTKLVKEVRLLVDSMNQVDPMTRGLIMMNLDSLDEGILKDMKEKLHTHKTKQDALEVESAKKVVALNKEHGAKLRHFEQTTLKEGIKETEANVGEHEAESAMDLLQKLEDM